MGRVMDLTGQRFGMLVVTERAPSHRTSGGQTKTVWRCRCDCGTEVTAQAAWLKSRRKVSCGCYRATVGARDDEVLGLRSGRLVATRRAGVEHGCVQWECQCDCGQTVVVRSTALRKQTTLSCGCISRERASEVADHVGYLGAHDRVTRLHGAASLRLCVDCGSRAEEWSYIGGDSDERRDDTGRCAGMPYSLSPAYYAPRCIPCHRLRDAKVRRAS